MSPKSSKLEIFLEKCPKRSQQRAWLPSTQNYIAPNGRTKTLQKDIENERRVFIFNINLMKYEMWLGPRARGRLWWCHGFNHRLNIFRALNYVKAIRAINYDFFPRLNRLHWSSWARVEGQCFPLRKYGRDKKNEVGCLTSLPRPEAARTRDHTTYHQSLISFV